MDLLKKTYLSIFRWNIFDSLSNQLLLIGHHMALRFFAGPVFHGIFSLTFAWIYFFLGILQAGFDSTLGYLWNHFSSKSNVISLIIKFVLFQIVLTALLILLVMVLTLTHNTWITSLYDFCPISIILCTIGIESIKKSIKSYALFALNPLYPVAIDFVGFIAYLVFIWTWYYWFGFSIEASLILLNATNSVQIIVLLLYLSSWWRSIPKNSDSSYLSHASFLQIRTLSGINHSSSQFFSSNFLLPLFSTLCSLPFISIAKIVSLYSQLITKLLQRSIGSTLLMTYTRASASLAYSVSQLQGALIGLTFFFSLIGPGIAYITCGISLSFALFLMFAFIILSLLEGLYALYDRYLTLEHMLPFLTIISVGSLAAVIVGASTISQYTSLFLLYLIGIRLFALSIVMHRYAKKNERFAPYKILFLLIGITLLFVVTYFNWY